MHKKDSEFFQVRSAELSGEKKVDIDSIRGLKRGLQNALVKNTKQKDEKIFPF